MDALSGDGAGSVVLAIINIVCAPSIATTKVPGVAFDPTGTCGVETSTTVQIAGVGVGTSALHDTCTVNASCTDGLVPSGWSFVGTGISTVATITTTSTMVDNSGAGVDTAALVCIFTACEHCTGTTKVTGVVCARTGTCTVATTTTSDLGGFGADSVALAAISTACESTSAGMDHVGML